LIKIIVLAGKFGMKALNIGIIGLSLLGLAACDSGGGGEAINTKFDYTVTPLAADERPWVILEGAQIEPTKHLLFSIKQDYYEEGILTTGSPYVSTIDEQINVQLQRRADDIEVSAEVTSSDPSIIAFENGKLVAKSVGTANLTITLDTTKPLSGVLDLSDYDFTGFQGTYDFGEVTVCPYTNVILNVRNSGLSTDISDSTQVFETVGLSVNEQLDIINSTAVEDAGLTPEQCRQTDPNRNDSAYIADSVSDNDFFEQFSAGTQSGINLLGFGFPNITMTKVSQFTNPRITEAGYDGKLALNAVNPLTIMATSPELNKDIEVTGYYLAAGNGGYDVPGISIGSENCSEVSYCVGSDEVNHTISLSALNLPTVSSSSLAVYQGIPNIGLSQTTGLPGTTFSVTSTLLLDGQIYDTTRFLRADSWTSGVEATTAAVNSSGTTFLGNTFTVSQAEIGSVTIGSGLNEKTLRYVTGAATDAGIRGRWVQADTGQDHHIGNHDTNAYTAINNDQITYQTPDNTTATLLRAGIENVAVSGSVNVVEETAAQANNFTFNDSNSSALARNFTPTARSLAGIGSIDMVLTNVNTGEATEVTVDAGGNFEETVPTGVYDVTGTVIDGGITYLLDTRITVEKDATDTGRLNLAKVGLYNFDVAISGCEYGYKCYAGQQYTFIITARNTGFIASSAVEAVITTPNHANVSQFTITSNPITGAAQGDSIQYQFTATFTQPAQDTVIEVPITLSDSSGRTWEDTLKVNLSQYPATSVNILAYNDGAAANVRGYLMLEGRTPIRVNGASNSIKVPNKPGASYELILANQEYNQETPYAVSFAATTSQQQISDATGIVSKNESADDVLDGATQLDPSEFNIAYISAGDVDYYLINIPPAP
jgi:hypothetical protein